YSQLSQQYHDESGANFIAPAGLQENSPALAAWRSATEATANAYRIILAELEGKSTEHTPSSPELTRAIKSAARSVLPNATESKIVVTANARAIRHFLCVRGSILGDSEMRAVSDLLYKMVRSEAPALVSDFERHELNDGSPLIERLRK